MCPCDFRQAHQQTRNKWIRKRVHPLLATYSGRPTQKMFFLKPCYFAQTTSCSERGRSTPEGPNAAKGPSEDHPHTRGSAGPARSSSSNLPRRPPAHIFSLPFQSFLPRLCLRRPHLPRECGQRLGRYRGWTGLGSCPRPLAPDVPARAGRLTPASCDLISLTLLDS